MAEAVVSDEESPSFVSSCPSLHSEETISPLDELAYVKSNRMRRVRWSEDLEEIRYFNVKSKKQNRRSSEDCSIGTDQMRRRFLELSNTPIEKIRKWLDEKDFKSDVVLLGLRMKSAFKKADFYDAEKKWEKDEVKKGPVNGIGYKQ